MLDNQLFVFVASWWGHTAWHLPDGSDSQEWTVFYNFNKGTLTIHHDIYTVDGYGLSKETDETVHSQLQPAEALAILEKIMPMRYWEFSQSHHPSSFLCDVCDKPQWQCGH